MGNTRKVAADIIYGNLVKAWQEGDRYAVAGWIGADLLLICLTSLPASWLLPGESILSLFANDPRLYAIPVGLAALYVVLAVHWVASAPPRGTQAERGVSGVCLFASPGSPDGLRCCSCHSPPTSRCGPHTIACRCVRLVAMSSVIQMRTQRASMWLASATSTVDASVSVR